MGGGVAGRDESKYKEVTFFSFYRGTWSSWLLLQDSKHVQKQQKMDLQMGNVHYCFLTNIPALELDGIM